MEFSHIVHSIEMIDHEVEADTNCQVSGWGATEWQGLMPAELRKANVSIVSRSFCNSTESFGRTFVDGMVCANEYNERGVVDVCQGGESMSLCSSRLLIFFYQIPEDLYSATTNSLASLPLERNVGHLSTFRESSLTFISIDNGLKTT